MEADISALNFDLTVNCSYLHRPLILRNSDLSLLLHVSYRIYNILLKNEDIGLLECDAGRRVKFPDVSKEHSAFSFPGLVSPRSPLTGAHFFSAGLQGPRVS